MFLTDAARVRRRVTPIRPSSADGRDFHRYAAGRGPLVEVDRLDLTASDEPRSVSSRRRSCGPHIALGATAIQEPGDTGLAQGGFETRPYTYVAPRAPLLRAVREPPLRKPRQSTHWGAIASMRQRGVRSVGIRQLAVSVPADVRGVAAPAVWASPRIERDRSLFCTTRIDRARDQRITGSWRKQ